MAHTGGVHWITAGFTPTVGSIYYYTPVSPGTVTHACICTNSSGSTAASIPSATSGVFGSGTGNYFLVLGVIPKITTNAWTLSAVYKIGDYVTTSNKLYVCGLAGTATGTAPTTTTKGTLDGTGAQFYYVSAAIQATSAVATQYTGSAYSTTGNLYVGDIVYYGQDVYSVIGTTASSTTTGATLPVPCKFGPGSQYYQYLFSIKGQSIIGFDDVINIELTDDKRIDINYQTGTDTSYIVKVFFQNSDSTYQTHRAFLDAFNNAFDTRGFGSYTLPQLPIVGTVSNWVSGVRF